MVKAVGLGRSRSREQEEEVMLTVWPWKVFSGRSLPSRHTWMHMSVLQEAKVVLFCQSTSRAGAGGVTWVRPEPGQGPVGGLMGLTYSVCVCVCVCVCVACESVCVSPEWKGNCCLASPVCASQMIVVWNGK